MCFVHHLPQRKTSDYCSVRTGFTDSEWSREWGIPRVFSSFQVLEFLGRYLFLWEDFKQAFKSKTKQRRVWSWSSHFCTKLNTPNNVLITCLPFSCLDVVWKKTSHKCPLKRKGSIVLQYHDTRNNYTWKGGNGKRKITITFSALGTAGRKMSSIEEAFARVLVLLL